MSCSACVCSDMDIPGSDNKVRFGFQIRDTAAFLVAYCCGTLNGASIKPGTWNIPEHSGTFRNIPEHPGTSRNIPEHEKIKIFFYEKIINYIKILIKIIIINNNNNKKNNR